MLNFKVLELIVLVLLITIIIILIPLSNWNKILVFAVLLLVHKENSYSRNNLKENGTFRIKDDFNIICYTTTYAIIPFLSTEIKKAKLIL